MKTFAQPRKTVKFTVLRTEDGVMNTSLLPTFWQRVAMKQAHKAIAHIIDDLKKQFRSQGPFVIAPIMWSVEVDMPMIYGHTYVYVKPFESEKN